MRPLPYLLELKSFGPKSIRARLDPFSGSVRREDVFTPADWDAFARPSADQIRGVLLGSLLWMLLLLIGLTLYTLWA
jgi:hypothetical protein